MQHHQHHDEFSVTDIRHTLNEVLRVISARRWYFVFPFGIVSTIACLCSLMVPRQYTASTVIKREHDPVFASMMGKNWNQPYEDIRKRMDSEIANPEFIRAVLEAEGLPRGLERFRDGTLTPSGEATFGQTLDRVVSGISTETLEASTHRDVVAVTLTTDRTEDMKEILQHVRDHYIHKARADTVEILAAVEKFLAAESEKCQKKLENLQQQLVSYELEYPGIRPGSVGSAPGEETALVIERAEIQRRIDDVSVNRERIETALAELSQTDAPVDMVNEEPNPRYAELTDEIERLMQEIADGRSARGMTEEHPFIVRARELLAARRTELKTTDRTLKIQARASDARAARTASIDQNRRKLGDLDKSLAVLSGRRGQIDGRLAELERDRALVVQHREAYLGLQAESQRVREELDAWRMNVAPVQNAKYLEDQDRSIHFATVREASLVSTPTSPDSTLVMMICFGVGIAAGVLSVLLVELIDRSYRTVKQLSSSLGIPVIESIDEIMTRATHRRRLVRSLILMPTLAVLLVTVTGFAGAAAYLSLERPADFASMKSATKQVIQVVTGRA